MAPNISSGQSQPNQSLDSGVKDRRRIESPGPEDKPAKEIKKQELGSYKDAVVPLIVLAIGYTFGYCGTIGLEPDPRTSNWFLMGSSLTSLIFAILYILFSTVWGPRYMKDKEPYSLKSFIQLYNCIQIVFSAWMFYEIGMSGWFFDYSYTCQPCDYSMNPKAVRMTVVAWYFFMSKLLDFMDTFFFVSRKKFGHISVLHVVHHSCMVVSMWFGVKYVPGGSLTFMGFINSLVHTVMYTYYFLASLGPAVQPFLWWKKYLTTFQLVQFVCIFLNSSIALILPSCNAMPTIMGLWTIFYAVIFFVLFMNFYRKAYKKSEKSKEPKKENSIKKVVFERLHSIDPKCVKYSPETERTIMTSSFYAS